MIDAQTHFAVTLLLCAAVEAGAVAPHLASVLPTGGQRGTQLEVSFQGDRLQDAEEIISYEPGLEVVKLSLVTNNIVKAQVKIAPDCRLGEHHLRVRTADRRLRAANLLRRAIPRGR